MLLADPALTIASKSVKTTGEIDQKIQNTEIRECEIRALEFEQDDDDIVN